MRLVETVVHTRKLPQDVLDRFAELGVDSVEDMSGLLAEALHDVEEEQEFIGEPKICLVSVERTALGIVVCDSSSRELSEETVKALESEEASLEEIREALQQLHREAWETDPLTVSVQVYLGELR